MSSLLWVLPAATPAILGGKGVEDLNRRKASPSRKFQIACFGIGLAVVLAVAAFGSIDPRLPVDEAGDESPDQVFYEWAITAPGGDISPHAAGSPSPAFLHGGDASAGGDPASSHLAGMIAAGLGGYLWPADGDHAVTLIAHPATTSFDLDFSEPESEPVEDVHVRPRPIYAVDSEPAKEEAGGSDDQAPMPRDETNVASGKANGGSVKGEAVTVFATADAETLPLPVRGEVLVPFGWTECPTLQEWIFHPGIDIAAGVGTSVQASAPGEVTAVQEDAEMAITVVVASGDLEIIYSALDEAGVEPGDAVKRGQVLGTVGSSPPREVGIESHLHWEVRDSVGEPVKIRAEEDGETARLIK